MNMRVPILLQYLDFNCFGYVSRSGIAELYDNSIFNLLGNLHAVSIVAALIYIPMNRVCGVSSHPFQHLLFLNHSNSCDVIFHCGLDLCFPNN